MNNEAFTRWCQEATAKIKYRPDRNAVAEELQSHMEDHYDVLIAKGLSPDEARQQTLAAMGSAEEIAPQLGAIHRPHLARFCRLVTCLAVIILLIELFGISAYFALTNNMLADDEWHEPVGYSGSYFTDTESETGRRVYYDKPTPRAYVNGYTIYAKRIAIWQYPEENNVFLELAIDRWLFTSDLDDSVPFSIYDNNGNQFWRWDYERTNGTITQTYMWSTSYSPEETIEWIEIHCERDGEDVVSLRIYVDGGDGS